MMTGNKYATVDFDQINGKGLKRLKKPHNGD